MKSIILSIFAFTVIVIAGCKQEAPKVSSQVTVIRHDESAKVDSSIVRAKDVDAASLDLNKDGKVYECPMDAEVIADAPGTCPLCKMDLEEVSIAAAKENLK